ncbi:flagellin [Planosporangium thailandense]|uniref:Flagellin n=1 Tax=Planosporangium thailandense TaxID=765197 RepID=A0ABX0XTI7_9ACTN|nr:flagellin [Planosporangium thailandense]
MGLRINTNISAMGAYRNLATTDKAMQTSLQRLSSGLRINKAADDAAGLAVSEGLRSQIGGLQVAARNAQDGINVVQVADGALAETGSILQRMRELWIAYGNTGSQDSNALGDINTEYQQLCNELDHIGATTTFGGQKLLDGTYAGVFQVDSGTGPGSTMTVDLKNSGSVTWTSGFMGVSALNLAVNAPSGLQNINHPYFTQLSIYDFSINEISRVRATLGAYQNRLEHTINNLNVAVENLSASKSSITDTDMAQEMATFSKAQIISQAGTAMLAQANQAPQGVLKLLG